MTDYLSIEALIRKIVKEEVEQFFREERSRQQVFNWAALYGAGHGLQIKQPVKSDMRRMDLCALAHEAEKERLRQDQQNTMKAKIASHEKHDADEKRRAAMEVSFDQDDHHFWKKYGAPFDPKGE